MEENSHLLLNDYFLVWVKENKTLKKNSHFFYKKLLKKFEKLNKVNNIVKIKRLVLKKEMPVCQKLVEYLVIQKKCKKTFCEDVEKIKRDVNVLIKYAKLSLILNSINKVNIKKIKILEIKYDKKKLIQLNDVIIIKNAHLTLINKLRTQIAHLKKKLNRKLTRKKKKLKSLKKNGKKFKKVNKKRLNQKTTNKRIKLKVYPIFIFDLFSRTKTLFIIPPTKHLFHLIKIMILLFRVILQSSEKFVCFFLITFRKLLLSLLKMPFFKINLNFIKMLNICYIKEVGFRHLNNIYFNKIFQERFLIFHIASFAINYSLNSFNKNNEYFIRFKGLHLHHISASLVSNFISIKLSQYYTIHDILRPLLRHLKKIRIIRGFKIMIAGRLTRKERAAYIIRRSGPVTLVKQSAMIDYATDFKIMRFGVVGVKVWLYIKYIYPYYYSFNFTYKKINN